MKTWIQNNYLMSSIVITLALCFGTLAIAEEQPEMDQTYTAAASISNQRTMLTQFVLQVDGQKLNSAVFSNPVANCVYSAHTKKMMAELVQSPSHQQTSGVLFKDVNVSEVQKHFESFWSVKGQELLKSSYWSADRGILNWSQYLNETSDIEATKLAQYLNQICLQ